MNPNERGMTMEFSPKTIAEIDKLYKGRHHVELSIGVLKDGEIT